MSIADKINTLHDNINNAFNAVSIKGGTIPSSRVINNLSSAISSIGAGLKPRIIVTTNGTAVYATKSGVRVDGVKSGDNFNIDLPSTGSWVVTATKNGVLQSSTISVTKIAMYNASITVKAPKPTDLTDTYWKWENGFTYTENGTSYNINFVPRSTKVGTEDCTRIYAPFSTFSIDWSGGGTWYYYASTWDGGVNYYYPGVKSTAMTTWVALRYWTYPETDWSSSTDDNVRYFHITGGSSVTNTTLINYLYKYATQCDSNWNPLT